MKLFFAWLAVKLEVALLYASVKRGVRVFRFFHLVLENYTTASADCQCLMQNWAVKLARKSAELLTFFATCDKIVVLIKMILEVAL